jgi:hypothetical protein
MALVKPEGPSPVRIHVDEDTRMPRRLRKFLEDRIAGYSKTVLQGGCTPELYKELTGKIGGLNEALRECEEIAKTLE